MSSIFLCQTDKIPQMNKHISLEDPQKYCVNFTKDEFPNKRFIEIQMGNTVSMVKILNKWQKVII